MGTGRHGIEFEMAERGHRRRRRSAWGLPLELLTAYKRVLTGLIHGRSLEGN